jgi:hypothetical protein
MLPALELFMFKWICLAVAAVFLAVLTWVANDVRLEIRRSSQLLQTTAHTVNEHLPTIVDKARKSTDILAEHLPEIVQKTRTTMDAVAELAGDIRQMRELLVGSHSPRDMNLVTYANSVLKSIEASNGKIGLKKLPPAKGLKSTLPAKDWVAGARLEAAFLTVVAKSKKELVTRLSKNKFGLNWYMEQDGKDPIPLLDWLKTNHAESKQVLSKTVE